MASARKWTFALMYLLAMYLTMSNNSFYDSYTYYQTMHFMAVFRDSFWQVNPQRALLDAATLEEFNMYTSVILVPNLFQMGQNWSSVSYRPHMDLFETQLSDPAWKRLGPVIVQQIRYSSNTEDTADEHSFDYISENLTLSTGDVQLEAHSDYQRYDGSFFYASSSVTVTMSGFYTQLSAVGVASRVQTVLEAWYDVYLNTWVSYQQARSLFFHFLLVNGDTVLIARIGRYTPTTGGTTPSIHVIPLKPPEFWSMSGLILLGLLNLLRCLIELCVRGPAKFFFSGKGNSGFDLLVATVVSGGLLPVFVLLQY